MVMYKLKGYLSLNGCVILCPDIFWAQFLKVSGTSGPFSKILEEAPPLLSDFAIHE